MLPDQFAVSEAAAKADSFPLAVKTYSFDTVSGMIGGLIHGADAMRQVICKRLLTPRGQYPIYSAAYGSELWRLRGENPSYVTALLPTYVRDALTDDDRIVGVDSFTFTYERGTLCCSFIVRTVYGSYGMELDQVI